MPKVSARSRSDSSSDADASIKYSCQFCDKIFGRSSDYRRHERTHTGERPHTCTWAGCTKSFSQSSGLKTHMNTHTGEQPHLCGYCESKFGDPSSRSRHRREVHGDEGTHECPYAGCHSTIKRSKIFYDHVYEKHNVRLTQEEVDACNPHIRNGICQRRKRSGRKSARAKAPTFVGELVTDPILELPVPLAVPTVPESYTNRSTGNIFHGYNMGSPFAESTGITSSASSSPSTIYGYNDRQSQLGYHSPYASAIEGAQFNGIHDSNFLTVPHSFAASPSSRSHSPTGSPALTFSSSPSMSPSPTPELTRLYSTVHHATPDLDPMAQFSSGQGSGDALFDGNYHDTWNLKELENDPQMKAFFASLKEDENNYEICLGNSALSQWSAERGFGMDGLPVLG
ncbi:hypothetical protein GGU10DRAFT_388496 [Lentinula aff. detonsa]|uniref:C2H2-type domain-containing protein n=1 Tax=Lentinula aff. detonsa TaxID=2804958 RepID=A0AA38NCI7_9AGAR|nr:hypothetical protein GGU10DRAFT_388496 [Lentinula aff. detonsa]